MRILCVGRLVAAKGQHVLIEAAARLHASGRRFRLVLVGGGPDDDSLRGAARAAGLDAVIEFTGPLDQAAVRAQYDQADVFALASFAEGIPVVLMEAMASGIACVATRVNGIPELIRGDHEGLLLAPGDAAGLFGALARLVDDTALRARMGDAGRLRVAADFELGRNVERLAAVFRRRIGGAAC